MRAVSEADIEHWRRHGYVIIERFLSDVELKAVHADLQKYMPTSEEYTSRQPLFADLRGGSLRSAPGWVRYEFPYVGDALNQVAVHPFLVAFVEALVGHEHIALSHGAIVGKYASLADYDQDLHPDYTNNTLVFPRDGVASIDIPMIVYHTDVTIDHGPTYVVSQEHTRDLVSDGRRLHPRDQFAELYELEKPAVLPAGSALIYNMRTFHRGSAMRTREGVRFSQFVAFHTTDKPWLGSNSFQGAGGSPSMDRFLTAASPRQRQLVGFPAPGDPYWDDDEARKAVTNRYPDMDMTPYGGRP
jgi:ectoine hydroxylase-related dioxygenase (phytanoyl-CoA dioxygenase family)